MGIDFSLESAINLLKFDISAIQYLLNGLRIDLSLLLRRAEELYLSSVSNIFSFSRFGIRISSTIEAILSINSAKALVGCPLLKLKSLIVYPRNLGVLRGNGYSASLNNSLAFLPTFPRKVEC